MQICKDGVIAFVINCRGPFQYHRHEVRIRKNEIVAGFFENVRRVYNTILLVRFRPFAENLQSHLVSRNTPEQVRCKIRKMP